MVHDAPSATERLNYLTDFLDGEDRQPVNKKNFNIPLIYLVF